MLDRGRQRPGLDHLHTCTLCHPCDHLLVQCPFSRKIWFKLCQGKGLKDIVPMQFETVRGCWASLSKRQPTSQQPTSQQKKVAIVAITGLERNARMFDRKSMSLVELVALANEDYGALRVVFADSRSLKGIPSTSCCSSCKCCGWHGCVCLLLWENLSPKEATWEDADFIRSRSMHSSRPRCWISGLSEKGIVRPLVICLWRVHPDADDVQFQLSER
jgi:hypothetical protein